MTEARRWSWQGTEYELLDDSQSWESRDIFTFCSPLHSSLSPQWWALDCALWTGFWLVTCCPCWPLIGHLLPPLALTNRIQCSDAFQLSRMSRAGASLFRLIIAHPWWLLTFYIFVAHLPLNRPAQFITEITLLSIILVSQLAFPVIRKFDTARDISMNIMPRDWLLRQRSVNTKWPNVTRAGLCVVPDPWCWVGDIRDHREEEGNWCRDDF